MTDRTPYQAGYHAIKHDGCDLCDNPYASKSQAQSYAGWKQGAMKALNEKNAEAKKAMQDAEAEASRELGRKGGL